MLNFNGIQNLSYLDPPSSGLWDWELKPTPILYHSKGGPPVRIVSNRARPLTWDRIRSWIHSMWCLPRPFLPLDSSRNNSLPLSPQTPRPSPWMCSPLVPVRPSTIPHKTSLGRTTRSWDHTSLSCEPVRNQIPAKTHFLRCTDTKEHGLTNHWCWFVVVMK